MMWVEMPHLLVRPDKHGLNEKMSRRVILGVEQQIKFFEKNTLDVAIHFSLRMIYCRDVWVSAEKIENNLAECDDVYGEIRILLAKAPDKRGQQNTVAITLPCENDNVLWTPLKGLPCFSMSGYKLQSAGKASAEETVIFFCFHARGIGLLSMVDKLFC